MSEMKEEGAREAILRRLRARARDVPHPAPWRSRRHFEDIVGRFEGMVKEVGGEVLRVANLAIAQERLHALFQTLTPKHVIVNPDPPISSIPFSQKWPHIHWLIVHPQTPPNTIRIFANQADIGISGAIAGFAETGTVVIAAGPTHSRLAVLLPPVHIVLLPVTSITTDVFTWIPNRPRPLPSNVVWITGPSKTADIEQTLATGVHGPGRLIVLLLEETTTESPQ